MRKRRSKKTRINTTAHRRAMAEPRVKRLVRELRQQWESVDRIERGTRLADLLRLGCSLRGLEEVLGQSLTTIRRHFSLVALADCEKDAIRSGASTKKILEKKSQADRNRRRLERIRQDAKTGEISNDLADVVLTFCRSGEAPVLKVDLVKFLNSIAIYLWRFDAQAQRPIRVNKRVGWSELLRRTRPKIDKDDFLFERQAEWLANILWALAQETSILQSVLQKVVQRSGELEITKKMTPSQAYRDAIERRFIRFTGPAHCGN